MRQNSGQKDVLEGLVIGKKGDKEDQGYIGVIRLAPKGIFRMQKGNVG